MGVPWDRATRAEARDFSRWIQLTVKPSRGKTSRRRSGQVGHASNPVTGKPPTGPGYAPATVAHSETVQETLRRLMAPPFLPAANGTRAGRRRAVTKLLRWLSSLPGDTWQQRWTATGAEDLPGASWLDLPLRWLREHGPSPSHDREDLASGLLMLIRGDVIRPGLPWMLTRTHRYLASVMAEVRDPDGFARLHKLAASGPASSGKDAQIAATRIATLLACKGGGINNITVGDCVELVDAQRRVHARGGQKKADFYLRLRALGVLPEDAPATIRAFGLALGPDGVTALKARAAADAAPMGIRVMGRMSLPV
ncbi:hypothetical protein ACFVYE_46020 [Streptomyces sp. NPDC058239]|uniref:hypothetical protein n=1 Tax=unclassified Streptomyces TaxID=2593676 RepID=UPI00364C0795